MSRNAAALPWPLKRKPHEHGVAVQEVSELGFASWHRCPLPGQAAHEFVRVVDQLAALPSGSARLVVSEIVGGEVRQQEEFDVQLSDVEL